jgi:hypothetical protein
MAESLYRGLQLGTEVTYGTAVAATTILPTDEGSGEFQLDRGTEFAEEDFGTQVAFLGGRGSHGVRMGTGTISSEARFEDLGHYFQMMIGAAVYTGVGPYTQTYTAGTTTDTTKSYTVELNNDVQDFIVSGVKANSLELGYDAIEAGENARWTVSVDCVANRIVKGTATAALTIPSVLETIEGHLTQIYQGTTATAFASLAELSAHLVQYRLRIEQEKPLRPYGGTVDYASTVGLRKRRSTMSALIKLSATSITDIYDIFDAAGGALTERRWRIKASGSGTKTLTIDHRAAFTDVVPDPDGRNGEYLLSVEGNATYDSTQASDLVIVIAGVANATLP